MKTHPDIRAIRRILLFFMAALLVSGLTAIPVDPELSFLLRIFPSSTVIHQWLAMVLKAYRQTNAEHRFLLYGYDWLAYAHIILALLFIGPYRDPVRNIWVVEFGMMSCVLVLPLAFIAGPPRGIPFGWQLIDCSFGIAGFLPLWLCYGRIQAYAKKVREPVAKTEGMPGRIARKAS